jgi:hypothetical protein
MAKKNQIVKLNEKVEVVGSGKYMMTLNKKYMVHPLLAQKLVAKGAARMSKPGKESVE